MKVHYVILTCEKYIPTRCEAIRKTWLRDTSAYSFLSSVPNPSEHILGWNTPDDYESCSQKYIEFFRNTTIDADWIVFCDDDTFVFPRRIEAALASANPDERLYIGYEFPKSNPPGGMSGGAGFVLSRACYTSLCEYIRTEPSPWVSTYTDVSMAVWLLTRLSGVRKQIDTRFHPFQCKSDLEFRNAFTFHYVTPADMIRYYAKMESSGGS